jgi:hypothetical protein
MGDSWRGCAADLRPRQPPCTRDSVGGLSASGGSASDLAVGKGVLVQGKLSSDGTSVQAVDIALGR